MHNFTNIPLYSISSFRHLDTLTHLLYIHSGPSRDYKDCSISFKCLHTHRGCEWERTFYTFCIFSSTGTSEPLSRIRVRSYLSCFIYKVVPVCRRRCVSYSLHLASIAPKKKSCEPLGLAWLIHSVSAPGGAQVWQKGKVPFSFVFWSHYEYHWGASETFVTPLLRAAAEQTCRPRTCTSQSA